MVKKDLAFGFSEAVLIPFPLNNTSEFPITISTLLVEVLSRQKLHKCKK